jgi:hypothetical protein
MTNVLVRCPRCGARVAEEAGRCPRCGHDLADEVVVLEPEQPIAAASSPSSDRPALSRVVIALVALVGAGIVGIGAGVRPVPSADLPTVAGKPLPGLGEPTGARLLVLVADEAWELDVDRRRAVPVPLPPGAVASVVGRPGAAVVAVGGRVVVARPGGALVELGRADDAFASEAPDRVWLRTGQSVREVALADGATTAGPVPVPAQAAAGGGLVVRDKEGGALVDPRTGGTVRELRDPIVLGAAGPWLVAADRNDFQCSVVPVSLATGARRRGPVLPYRSCFFGRTVLSADGGRVGVPVAESIEQRDGRSNSALFVVDVVGGGAVEVPGTRRLAMPYRSLTWTPSARWLFWTDHAAPHRIGAYRVGSSTAVAVDTTGLPAGQLDGLWAFDG